MMEREAAIIRLKELIGKDLHELVAQYEVTVFSRNGNQNKGWAGHTLERHLGLPTNSRQEPDFGSWELKVIPLRHKSNGELTFK